MLRGVTDLQVRRIHPAWWAAAVTFLALVGAAGFRAVPGVLMDPLHQEFGWSITTISVAISVNMALYGLTSPFAAALMERFGIRKVVTAALLVVASGSGLTVFMTASWQLVLCWGVLVGLGTGSMALALVATVTGRWFVTHRGRDRGGGPAELLVQRVHEHAGHGAEASRADERQEGHGGGPPCGVDPGSEAQFGHATQNR